MTATREPSRLVQRIPVAHPLPPFRAPAAELPPMATRPRTAIFRRKRGRRRRVRMQRMARAVDDNGLFGAHGVGDDVYEGQAGVAALRLPQPLHGALSLVPHIPAQRQRCSTIFVVSTAYFASVSNVWETSCRRNGSGVYVDEE